MSQTAAKMDNLSPLKRALLAVEEMKGKLKALQQERNEPIAVVGVGLRFPGAKDVEQFWELLKNGVDAIREVPPDRWDVDAYYDPNPQTPGKMVTRWGGFIDEVDKFDPQFFGISPREAARMDPQQRLLLEVTWEALENAGINPQSLAKSKTGVFVGISSNDYSRIQGNDLRKIDPYTGTGNAFSIAANRLSYAFDFQGPSVAVDTACSSSLVTIHLAVLSLRSKESDLALAGGVNLILSPELSITFSQAGMLAPGGRCRTFDAAAEGYVRGEGCGMVVLKRLSDALRDGDRILAVIRGSAVNQDGKSNGLTAPNSLAQQRVVRQALKNAGVKPEAVGYIEAHGTGTILGDPIEVQALGMVMKNRPKEKVCYLGSVKTNIGHLESAAGVAGFIKAVLAVYYGKIPPHLHFQQINPHIPIDELPFAIPTTLTDWPEEQKHRIAGVSSFGFGGTNAHIVVEAPPKTEPTENSVDRTHHVLTLSAHTSTALQEYAGKWVAYLKHHPDISLSDACFTANTGRAHFSTRAAIVADSIESLKEALSHLKEGQNHFAISQGVADQGNRPKVAFLFTGQGAQYPGMGKTLYQTSPTAKKILDEIQELSRSHLPVPLLDVLLGEGDHKERIHQTAYTQPALFAVEYTLAQLWMQWGVQPDYLIGHSIGEITAACIAGVLSLEDAVKLVCARGRLMQELPENGSMAALFTRIEKVEELLQGQTVVAIAGINGPQNVVISGEKEALARTLAAAAAEGIEYRELKVSHAFHSPLMEPMLDPFFQIVSDIQFQAPKIPIVSNVTGQLMAEGQVPDAQYWKMHVRQPVRFADGMQTLAEQGVSVFLETGPHPVLIGMGRKIVDNPSAVWVPSLKRDQEDWYMLLMGVGELFSQGVTIDFKALDRDYHRQKVSLPTYPFQRERYWVDWATSGTQIRGKQVNPLLGSQLATPLSLHLFENSIDESVRENFGELQYQGVPLWGIGHLLIMAQQALQQKEQHKNTFALKNLSWQHPLILAGATPVVQTIVKNGDNNATTVEIFHQQTEETWVPLFTASHTTAETPRPVALPDVDGLPITGDAWYHRLKTSGWHWGAPLKQLAAVYESEQQLIAQFQKQENSNDPLALVTAIEVLAQLIAGWKGKSEIINRITTIEYWQWWGGNVPVKCLVQQETDARLNVFWFDEENRVVMQAIGVHIAPADEKWHQWFVPFIAEKTTTSPAVTDTQPMISREHLMSADPQQRPALLQDYFRQQLAQVLKLPPNRIDPRQPITNLGLDSILAIELKNNIEQQLAVELPVAWLIEGVTLEELGNRLVDQFQSDTGKGQVVRASGQQSGEFPLSYGQKAMWFQHQMAPKSIFNPAYAARIRSRIDVPRLKAAFQTVVDRHAMLRTTFRMKDGNPIQQVAPSVPVAFQEVDAHGWEKEQLKKTITEEALRPFDLEKGPLFRIHLFHVGEEEHVLLMASHHIVVDMWSQAVITNEVTQLYNAITDLPPVDFQYMDFVHWQQELLNSEKGEALWAYWQQELAGELPILELPTDRPRPAVQTFDGRLQTLSLGKTLTKKLQQLSEQHGVTLYMTLLAAFQTLLARYSGQQDIIVGTPTTGRSQPEFTNTVGYFVNPVAIRVHVNDEMLFPALLEQVRQKVIGALKHQDYPINLLVEKLQPRRDPSRTPIFQVMFVYQRAHLLAEEGLSGFAVGDAGARLQLGGLPLEAIPLEEQVAPFDITLMMAEGSDGLAASITYNVELFEESTIQHMLQHFRNLLEGIVEDGNRPVQALPLLSKEEQRLLVEGWNDTHRTYPSLNTALEAFHQAVTKYPDKPAVIFHDQQMSYAELDTRANQLAHYLKTQGIGAEDVVGICVNRSLNMIVGILGILKAGAAYLPLDPEYPQERLQFLIDDSGARLLLADSATAQRVPSGNIPILLLDEESSRYLDMPSTEPDVTVYPENLAYMIYTSGSTGKPKGVAIEHRTLLANMFAMTDAFHVDHTSRVLQFASFSFDASVEEIFGTLFRGATLVMVSREVLLSAPALLEEMRRQEVTMATFPPSFSRVLPDVDLPQLKTVVSAGESCTPEIARRWQKVPHFINAYGPTETTICATTFEVTNIPERSTVPIGKPIANVRVYILDKRLQPVPPGIAGEVFIGGIAVGRGYHRRPALTAERFLPDPFSPHPGARMYRTGDLARYLPDGSIEFLGRVDFQVKVRGFRIELEEIEAHLLDHPHIQQAAVVAHATAAGETRLVGYVVPHKGKTIDPPQVRQFLKERLPDYMVPPLILVLEALPLTPSGKVDRKALPAAESLQKERPKFVAPTSGVEQQVAELWKEILQVDAVGVNDNFFDLGGHSLNVIQLQTRVKEVFHRDIAVVDLFKYPTVSAFAKFLSDGHDSVVKSEEARQRAAKQRSALDAQRARMRRRRQSG